MSSVDLLVNKNRTISKTGGTAAMYVPKELQEYIGVGDSVKVTAKIEGNQIVMTVSKSLFNFSLDEIKNSLEKFNFKITKEETIGDVNMFEAKNKNVILSYTKNLYEQTSPAYIIVKKSYSNIDFKKYKDIFKNAEKLREKFDVIMRPEGDLDTVKVLRNPESYKVDMKKAFTVLKEANKKIGFGIVIRINNKKNRIDELTSALETLNF